MCDGRRGTSSSRVTARSRLKRSAFAPSSWPPRGKPWSQRVWWKWSMLGDGDRCATWVGAWTAAGLFAGCLAFQRLRRTVSERTSEYFFLIFFFLVSSTESKISSLRNSNYPTRKAQHIWNIQIFGALLSKFTFGAYLPLPATSPCPPSHPLLPLAFRWW